MGQIEETILANYQTALRQGDLDQAKRAIELASLLKSKIEADGFLDFSGQSTAVHPILGDIFSPFPYRYYPEDGIVILDKSAINLTDNENKLFSLLSDNESNGRQFNVISRKQIKQTLWPSKNVTNNAVRISVHRLRSKLEPIPDKPRYIINFNHKGYIFLGKREN
jgi:DNA-binding winged helix-turn-helix (wHTH) protein